MLKKVDYYYFSPTGGTKKTGEICLEILAEEIKRSDLASREWADFTPESELIVAAVPVFGGRIPALAAQKLKQLNGAGKKAVTLAVYGVRAYEDALLELNDLMTECGFQIIASAALIAQHSVVPEVGMGRPDEQDAAEIRAFAEKVLTVLDGGAETEIKVPGNHPYKQGMNMPVSPMTLPDCGLCGTCVEICPTEAVKVEKDTACTDVEKCILCMACVKACPAKARILPPPLQEQMNQMLLPFAEVRRENEFFFGE